MSFKEELKELLKNEMLNDSTISQEDILYFSKSVKLKYKMIFIDVIDEIIQEFTNDIESIED